MCQAESVLTYLFSFAQHMKGTRNLTEGKIGQNLLQLAIPIMGTSFIQIAYSLTDMAWVGRLGSESIAAVGAVGIFTWMSSSISLLNKVGSEVSVAHAIGMKDASKAVKYASHNLTMSLLLSLLWGAFLFFGAGQVLSIYHLETNIHQHAVDYLHIVSTALPFVFVTAAATGIFNASGRSKIPFYVNSIGLIVNMLLDPLLIFGFDMGTQGAAIATWIAQFMVCGAFIYLLVIKRQLFQSFSFFTRLRATESWRIVKLGFPVALLNTLFSFVTMYLGRSTSVLSGHIGLMALTTGGQIEAITWNTAQGFSTALSAFVAQNFAARKTERVLAAYRYTLRITLLFGTVCTFLFIFFGNEIFAIFVPEKAAYMAGGEYLRIDGYSQLLMMVEIATQGIFYGVGRTVPPAIVSIGGNYLRIPLSILFISSGWGIDSIWWSISISSMLKGIALFIWYIWIKKHIIN